MKPFILRNLFMLPNTKQGYFNAPEPQNPNCILLCVREVNLGSWLFFWVKVHFYVTYIEYK